MRPDHTATDYVSAQPLLPSPLDGIEVMPRKRVPALTRITFCFAWLFGLEAFLTGSVDDVPSSFD
ncbi:hypothetical protein LFL96_25640 [Paraburkholderia sp. D15]|uniref:hypothetical protein n=1 Tax=Paraburkholderia sp. D15 TaxID=2880218 RepID=UPI00247952F6|nr:hypothetical protein [Paraburkholderia sp. D15]WGS54399.1 hypothetical protein LFL96_25640 [Paraburkholderia sp. D15]WKF60045.1 hypothetical protein HUO10_004557 [Paraburkholderia busanensis]